MAGWTCSDKEKICWDGTICADSFTGDGSQLTGIAAGGGGGTTLWASAANVIYPKAVGQTISGANLHTTGNLTLGGTVDGIDIAGQAVFVIANTTHRGSSGASHSEVVGCSGAITTHVADTDIHFTSGAIYTYADGIAGGYSEASGASLYTSYQITSGALATTSGALKTDIGNNATNIATVSGALNTTSGALKIDIANRYSESSGALLWTTYQITSGALATTSGALKADIQLVSGAYTTHAASGSIHYASSAIYTEIDTKFSESSGAGLYTAYQSTSGAYISHAADSSDPHGATLTQTNLKFTSGAITGDGDTLSGARLQNIVIGTGATPPTASNFPRGTIYVQYTP